MSDWSYNALWQLKKQMLGIFSKGTEQNQDIFILLYKSALTYLMNRMLLTRVLLRKYNCPTIHAGMPMEGYLFQHSWFFYR